MIMEIVRCSKGHFYDSEENGTCPLCAAEAGDRPTFDNILPTDAFVSDTVPQRGNVPRPTEPVADAKVQQYKPTVGTGSTVAGSREGAFPKTEPIPMGDTTEKGTGFNPVVGWLVCIDGAVKGRDYRIHSQNNFIGRSAKMDISVPEDPHISAENSAIIAYDDVERAFFFGPGFGHNVVRVNGKLTLNTTMLEAYDVLTVGMTKLLFVPLCGDRFDWNEEK